MSEKIPATTIVLDDDHYLTPVLYHDEPAGWNQAHKGPDGQWCRGWVARANSSWSREFDGSIQTWDVFSEYPLTLSPSILCNTCGDHGYVRDGRWVAA